MAENVLHLKKNPSVSKKQELLWTKDASLPLGGIEPQLPTLIDIYSGSQRTYSLSQIIQVHYRVQLKPTTDPCLKYVEFSPHLRTKVF
jgi:hypothetical protein